MVISQYKQVSIMLYTWNKCQLHLNLKNSRENLSVWIQHQSSLASKDTNGSAAPSETAATSRFITSQVHFQGLYTEPGGPLKLKKKKMKWKVPLYSEYIFYALGRGKKKKDKISS